MSLAKLISLVDTNHLYFSRSDLLGDPFEGSWARRQPVREYMSTIVKPEIDAFNRKVMWQVTRESVAVNCWYLGEAESVAMWHQYGLTGLAIQTTFARLTDALPKKSGIVEKSVPIFVGTVQYIDYETASIPEGNVYWPFMHKRQNFAHEREVRAVVHRIGDGYRENKDLGMMWSEPGIAAAGVSVPIDVTRLVSRVYVSPASEPWFADVVRAVLRTFGVDAEVVHSALDTPPIY